MISHRSTSNAGLHLDAYELISVKHDMTINNTKHFTLIPDLMTGSFFQGYRGYKKAVTPAVILSQNSQSANVYNLICC